MTMIDSRLVRAALWLDRRLSPYPDDWFTDRTRLDGWQADHANPDGDVWAVSPPYGVEWALWAPGFDPMTAWDLGLEPVATTTVDADRERDGDVLFLADVEQWMRPWIEEIAGRRVVDMVDGLLWSGPANNEYLIYARVDRGADQ